MTQALPHTISEILQQNLQKLLFLLTVVSCNALTWGDPHDLLYEIWLESLA